MTTKTIPIWMCLICIITTHPPYTGLPDTRTKVENVRAKMLVNNVTEVSHIDKKICEDSSIQS